MKFYSDNIEELLRGYDKLYESDEDKYTREILDDIEMWFEEESEKEEYLQEKFKENKHFDFKVLDFDE